MVHPNTLAAWQVIEPSLPRRAARVYRILAEKGPLTQYGIAEVIEAEDKRRALDVYPALSGVINALLDDEAIEDAGNATNPTGHRARLLRVTNRYVPKKLKRRLSKHDRVRRHGRHQGMVRALRLARGRLARGTLTVEGLDRLLGRLEALAPNT